MHRDLKPDNILIKREDGAVKVCDYGLADKDTPVGDGEGKNSETAGLVGTLPYISPEQYDGGAATTASDVWSLGVIAYQLVERKLPFSVDLTTSLVYKNAIMNNEPDLVETGVPQPLMNLTMMMLQKNIADRMTLPEILESELIRKCNGKNHELRDILIR